MIIVQIHVEDNKGYIRDHEDFIYNGEVQNWTTRDGRYIGNYISYALADPRNDKVVIKKYER